MQAHAKHRPMRTYETGEVIRVLRWVSWIVTMISSALLMTSYPQMPQEVPVHFNAMGQPDEYGNKIAVLGLACGIILVQLVIYWASKKPQVMDYPAKVTDENAQRLYREGERFFVCLGLSISALMAGISALYLSFDPMISNYLIWLSLAVMAAVFIGSMVRMRQVAKPASPSDFPR